LWIGLSPSRVFADIGRDVIAGLAMGLNAEQDGIRSSANGFADDVAGTFSDILLGGVELREGLANLLGGIGDNLLGRAYRGCSRTSQDSETAHASHRAVSHG
jgi:hypothetical protein